MRPKRILGLAIAASALATSATLAATTTNECLRGTITSASALSMTVDTGADKPVTVAPTGNPTYLKVEKSNLNKIGKGGFVGSRNSGCRRHTSRATGTCSERNADTHRQCMGRLRSPADRIPGTKCRTGSRRRSERAKTKTRRADRAAAQSGTVEEGRPRQSRRRARIAPGRQEVSFAAIADGLSMPVKFPQKFPTLLRRSLY
jgi:hypothetical protein